MAKKLIIMITLLLTIMLSACEKDTTAPVIVISGDQQITITVGDTYTDAGATATDDVDNNVTVETSSTVDTNNPGTYTITYTAIDEDGNQSTATRTVIVQEREITNLDILTPFGTPLLSLLNIAGNPDEVYDDQYSFSTDVVYGADPLVAAFKNNEYDVILAPTNLGAKLYSAFGNYQYAGSINNGSLYLISSDVNFNIDSITNQDILAFGQGSTPQIILENILDYYGKMDSVTVNYLPSVSDVQFTMTTEGYDIALVSEPQLSAYISQNGNVGIIDLQAEWAKITGRTSYPQAGVFVSKDADKDAINSFLNALEDSVNYTNSLEDSILNIITNLDLGFDQNSIMDAIPRCNVVFNDVNSSKEDLIYYFNQIYNFNPALIGGSLPSDEFYYEK